MAQILDIRQAAKMKAAVLADAVFDLQHNISHGGVQNIAQLKSLDEITARLDSMVRVARTGLPGQRCTDCNVELKAENRAVGFGALCKLCDASSR